MHPQDRPPCLGCRWFHHEAEAIDDPDRCWVHRDLVQGFPVFRLCEEERSAEGDCGPEGLLFEPRYVQPLPEDVREEQKRMAREIKRQHEMAAKRMEKAAWKHRPTRIAEVILESVFGLLMLAGVVMLVVLAAIK